MNIAKCLELKRELSGKTRLLDKNNTGNVQDDLEGTRLFPDLHWVQILTSSLRRKTGDKYQNAEYHIVYIQV